MTAYYSSVLYLTWTLKDESILFNPDLADTGNFLNFCYRGDLMGRSRRIQPPSWIS